MSKRACRCGGGLGAGASAADYEALQQVRRELTALSARVSRIAHPGARTVERQLDATRRYIFDLPG